MEEAFSCFTCRNKNGTRKSLCDCGRLHNIAVRLHEPMEDEEVDELADVDPYHGPQQGLSLRDHICQTFFG